MNIKSKNKSKFNLRILQNQAEYCTELGYMIHGDSKEILSQEIFNKLKRKVQLIFTSPPFPLNRKKKYGNLNGVEFMDWLAEFGIIFAELLKPNGSIVIEMGNAWERNSPVMSTLSTESLLNFKQINNLFLCQEFIYHNPAKLPTPAQWVNIERIRVKDAFTKIWWLSKKERPYANNRNILLEYSKSMQRLLETKKYNSGKRPSEHNIGEKSFLKNNRGSIPSNVLIFPNTVKDIQYSNYCEKKDLILHPARMPRKVAEYFIKFLSKKGDIVLDPFAGSNVTGFVAETLNRNWIAIESNKEYIKGSKGRFCIKER